MRSPFDGIHSEKIVGDVRFMRRIDDSVTYGYKKKMRKKTHKHIFEEYITPRPQSSSCCSNVINSSVISYMIAGISITSTTMNASLIKKSCRRPLGN